MRVFRVTPATTASDLASLTLSDAKRCDNIVLQADATGITYGDHGVQPFPVETGDPVILPAMNIKDLWVKGDGSAKLSIMILP